MIRKERHPSERPIHKNERKMLGFPRRAYDEPLSPGLRYERNRIEAIGFVTNKLIDHSSGDE